MIQRAAIIAEIERCHARIIANREENKRLKARTVELYEQMPWRDLDYDMALAEAGKENA